MAIVLTTDGRLLQFHLIIYCTHVIEYNESGSHLTYHYKQHY